MFENISVRWGVPLLLPRAQAQDLLVNRLPADSPALFRQFFHFHSSFSDWLTARTSGRSPAVAADLNRKAASAFGLKEADHQLVMMVTGAIGRELRAIDQEQIAHANARARMEQHPAPAVLGQLELRRQDAVSRGITQLQQTLPAEAWSALRGYINGPYRNGIRIR